MEPTGDLGGFYVSIAAAVAALLITVVAASYAATQTFGVRFGREFGKVVGVWFPHFAIVSVVVLTVSVGASILAARPDLDSFLGLQLPFADAASRPETAAIISLGFFGTLGLGAAR